MIERFERRLGVRRMCSTLRVSRSGYYAWRGRPASPRELEDRRLKVEIRAAFLASRGRYGSPRIFDDLRELGYRVSEKRVARLMREEGLQGRHRRRFRGTTDSTHELPVAPNVLGRNFAVEAPDQVWVGDITFVPTREGWLYLAILLDLASRYVVGWATSESLEDDLTLAALDRAIETRRPAAGLIHHSDRGGQYASHDYAAKLEQRGLVASMSRAGNCWDNAPAESFFSTFKLEAMPDDRFGTRGEARDAIFEYIEVFYNRQRRHSSLGGVSPAAYEARRREQAA
jgi:transposase InsO family protein